MAYYTGPAANVNAVLAAIKTHAQNDPLYPWAVDYDGARTGTGAGKGNAVSLRRGACIVTFRSDAVDFAMELIGHDQFSTAPGFTTEIQPNSSQYVNTNQMIGPMQGYHVFIGDKYIYCVVETLPGVYKHIGTGLLEPFGSISPGHFIYAAQWAMGSTDINSAASGNHAIPFRNSEASNPDSTRLRIDYDGNVNYWISQTGGNLSFFPQSVDDEYRLTIPSNYTQRSPLGRQIFCVRRGSNLRTFAGMPINIRLINLTWIAPGDVLTVGSDEWMCFPIIRRNGAPTEPNSGVYGFAYKK